MRKKLLSLFAVGLFSFCAMTDGVQAQSTQEIEEIEALIEVYDNKGLTEEADAYREKLEKAKFSSIGLEQVVTTAELQQMNLNEIISLYQAPHKEALNQLKSQADATGQAALKNGLVGDLTTLIQNLNN